jgi:hypothetical protein
MITLRRPDTTATPVIVKAATKHSVISEPIIALLASGVTTNSVTTSITSNAVRLYSCSQNRARWSSVDMIDQECLTLISNFHDSFLNLRARAQRHVQVA